MREAGAQRVVVLPTADWLRRSLEPLGFREVDRILEMRHARPEAAIQLEGMEVHLRPAIVDDLDALLAIDRAAFDSLWRMDHADLEAALDAGARITLAQVSDRIVGFQITYVVGNRAHLARLGVVPDSQGQGIGSALLAAELATYRAADAITLNVLGSSHGAQRLYTRLGFEFSGNDTPLWTLDLGSGFP